MKIYIVKTKKGLMVYPEGFWTSILSDFASFITLGSLLIVNRLASHYFEVSSSWLLDSFFVVISLMYLSGALRHFKSSSKKEIMDIIESLGGGFR